jgi:ArsR family transcriptional regulator
MRADGLVSITCMTELPDRQRGVSRELPGAGPDGDDAWADARATLLKALADPTRLSMVAALRRASAPVCICDFTAAYELTQPTISHHMARLRAAGLVEASRRGIWVYYWLRADLPSPVARLLEAVLAAS